MARLTKLRDRRGLAAVEAAIFFPLLFLLLFGMIEYGWAFLKFQCINNAAREGVRVAVRDGATDPQWQAAVVNVMNGCTITVYDTPTLTGGTVGSPPGTQLTCNVTVQYVNIGLTQVSLFPTPVSLTGTATMVKEGPL